MNSAGEIGGYDVRVAVEAKYIVGRLSLIESHSAVLYARFERIPAVDPSQVVDHPEGRADFDVGRVVVQPHEIGRAYCVGEDA